MRISTSSLWAPFAVLLVLTLLCSHADAGSKAKKGPNADDFHVCPMCCKNNFVWDFVENKCMDELQNSHSMSQITEANCAKDCESNKSIYTELLRFIEDAKKWDGKEGRPSCPDPEKLYTHGNDANWAERHIKSNELKEAWVYAWSLTPFTCEMILDNLDYVNAIPLKPWPRCPEFSPEDGEGEVPKLKHAAQVLEAFHLFSESVRAAKADTVTPDASAGAGIEHDFASAMKKLNSELWAAKDDVYTKISALKAATGCATKEMYKSFGAWNAVSRSKIQQLWAKTDRMFDNTDDFSKQTIEGLRAESRELNDLCRAISKKIYQFGSASDYLNSDFWHGCFTYAFHDVPNATPKMQYKNIAPITEDRLAKVAKAERDNKNEMDKQARKRALRDAVANNKADYEQMLENIRKFPAQNGKDWFKKYRCMEVYIFAMESIDEPVPASVTEERRRYYQKATAAGVINEADDDRTCRIFTDSENIMGHPDNSSWF